MILRKQPGTAAIAFFRRLTASAFVQRVTGTFATRVALVGLAMMISIIITRLLGPAGRGQFAMATALATLGAQMVNLGLHSANTFHVANDRSRLPLLVGNSILVSTLVGTLFGLGYATFSWLFPGAMPVEGALLFLALAWIPLGAAYQLIQGLLIGTNRIRAYNTIEIVANLCSLALLAALILTEQISVEVAFGVGLVAVGVSLTLSVRTLLRGLSRPIGFSKALLKESVGYGMHIYLICLASYAMRRADLFIIEHYLGDSASGIYSVSQTLAEKAYLFPETLGMLLFPKLVAETTARAERTIKAALIAVATIAVILLIALPLLNPIIGLVYGEEFQQSTVPALILIGAMAFYAVGNIVGAYILAHGKNLALVLMWFCVAAVNIAANFYVVPRFGTGGAAVCLLGTYAVAMLMQIGIALRVQQTEPAR